MTPQELEQLEQSLTAKQRAFVREYLIDRNASKAAIRAGYREATAGAVGFNVLQKPTVQAVLAAHEADLAKNTKRTALEVLRDIQEVAQESRQNGDLRTALRALELEGKHIGMFTDKVQNEFSGGFTVSWRK